MIPYRQHNLCRKLFLPFLFTIGCGHAFAETLTDHSLGAISIGTPAEQARTQLPSHQDDKANYPPDNNCYYFVPPEYKGVFYMVIDEKVARIDIDSVDLSIKTTEGVGVGSTKEAVLQAYKEVLISEHPYLAPDGEYLEVKLSNGNGLIFETLNGSVIAFRLGSYPALSYIEGCV